MTTPHHLWPYETDFGYLFTDHGEIYYGIIETFSQFDDRAFVFERTNFKTLKSLEEKDVTLENIESLGWEIKDYDKIIHHEPGGFNNPIGNTSSSPDTTRYGMQEWKRMFVFGAGASAYSVFKEDMDDFRKSTYCPPIANELFGKKFQHHIRKYEGVERSLASLKRYGNQVEDFFEHEWGDILNALNRDLTSRHINVTFYLRELFNKISEETIDNYFGSSIYAAFCDHLQKSLKRTPDEKIAFVSFNYDTLLDHSISKYFNHQFNVMTDYIPFNKKPFMLFKPHGSCNWGWKFRQEFLNENIQDIPKYLFENNVSFAEIYYNLLGDFNHTVWRHSWGYKTRDLKKHLYTINKNIIEVIQSSPENYFPALLIPYKEKDEFVMPYYHLDIMREFIRRMEDLYLIGWKGNEAAFNHLLKGADHLKRIVIVNPYPETVIETLKEHKVDLDKFEVISDKRTTDFETFLNSDLL